MQKVAITVDSTCDLSKEIIKRFGITGCFPLNVILDGKEYFDGVDLYPDDIYKYYRSAGKLPKTSAPSPQDFIDFFKPYLDEGYEIVHFDISSQFSATYQNAVVAAKELGHIYPVDSMSLSTGSGLLALKACELRNAGLSAEAIARQVRGMTPFVRASFVIDNLEFLHKGGRCSGVAALGANLLKLKPTIMLTDGKMGVGKKYRGNLQTVLEQYTREILTAESNLDRSRVFITHSGIDPAIVEAVQRVIQQTVAFEELFVTRAGCTVSSHCGPNTLGVLFMLA